MSREAAAQLKDVLRSRMWGSNGDTLMTAYAGFWEASTGLSHPYSEPVDPMSLPRPGGSVGKKIEKIADTPVIGTPTYATVRVSSLRGRQVRSEYSSSQIRRLKKRMKKDGYDESKPIDVAVVDGKRIVIDGHHRARAAGAAGIKDVPVRVWQVDDKTGMTLFNQAAEAAERLGLHF